MPLRGRQKILGLASLAPEGRRVVRAFGTSANALCGIAAWLLLGLVTCGRGCRANGRRCRGKNVARGRPNVQQEVRFATSPDFWASIGDIFNPLPVKSHNSTSRIGMV